METRRERLSRRNALKFLGVAGSGLAFQTLLGCEVTAALAQERPEAKMLEGFTGPGPNPHWSSVGPYVNEPQKAPLILLTDRPVQLETPRSYFRSVLTPNDAFYVRW